MVHSKKKTVFEKDLVAEQLEKDFKITILMMFTELNDKVNKVKMMMYE